MLEDARDKQVPPFGDWFCWLLLSGRGFGKTRTGAEFVNERARQGYERIALIGQTKADVRDTMIELEESSILNVAMPAFMPDYQPSKRRVVWPNGTVATIFSGDEPDQLRGPQHDTVWIDEFCKFKYPQQTWDNMELGLRVGPDPRVVVTTSPRPIPVIKMLLKDPRTITVRGTTYENIDNLAPSFVERIRERYEGTYFARQELHGEVLEDREGALWKRRDIEAHRRTSHPDLVRVVVGVDPPGGVTECGIVVAGVDEDKQAYVLGDASLAGSPDKWGKAVAAAYHTFKAGRVAAEANFGGDMVESTIKTVDRRVPVKLVRATRGKAIRAEPIVALYEQGKVHHIGFLPLLEDELCSWVPGEAGGSPNRLDALVWALTELMLHQSLFFG